MSRLGSRAVATTGLQPCLMYLQAETVHAETVKRRRHKKMRSAYYVLRERSKLCTKDAAMRPYAVSAMKWITLSWLAAQSVGFNRTDYLLGLRACIDIAFCLIKHRLANRSINERHITSASMTYYFVVKSFSRFSRRSMKHDSIETKLCRYIMDTRSYTLSVFRFSKNLN